MTNLDEMRSNALADVKRITSDAECQLARLDVQAEEIRQLRSANDSHHAVITSIAQELGVKNFVTADLLGVIRGLRGVRQTVGDAESIRKLAEAIADKFSLVSAGYSHFCNTERMQILEDLIAQHAPAPASVPVSGEWHKMPYEGKLPLPTNGSIVEFELPHTEKIHLGRFVNWEFTNNINDHWNRVKRWRYAAAERPPETGKNSHPVRVVLTPQGLLKSFCWQSETAPGSIPAVLTWDDPAPEPPAFDRSPLVAYAVKLGACEERDMILNALVRIESLEQAARIALVRDPENHPDGCGCGVCGNLRSALAAKGEGA